MAPRVDHQLGHFAVRVVQVAEDAGLGRAGLHTCRLFTDCDAIRTQGALAHRALDLSLLLGCFVCD